LSCRDTGRTLLIATWGNPNIWDEFEYVIGEGGPSGRKYCTSLIPLLLSLGRNTDTVIIVLDSLVDGQVSQKETACCKCYNELYYYLKEAKSFNSYLDLVLKLEEFVKKFFTCLVEKYGLTNEIDVETIRNTKVVVAPAVGSPGGNWEFRGDIRNFQSIVMSEIGDLLLRNCYSKIVLDLSHGINFMPSTIMYIVSRLASVNLLAHKHINSIDIEVYNSDPPRSIRDRPLLLNKAISIKKRNIELIHEKPRVAEPCVQEKTNVSEFIEIKKEIEKYADMALVDLYNIYLSIYYPVPLGLYLATNKASCQRIDEAYSKIKAEIRKIAKIEDAGKARTKVKWPLVINPDFIYLLQLSRGVCNRLSNKPNGAPTLEQLKNEDLTRVYEYVYRGLPKLINNELSLIEKLLGEFKEKARNDYEKMKGKWVLLCEIKEKLNVDSCKNKDKPIINERIMIAHVGFQDNIVEIYINDEKPKMAFRYSLSLNDIVSSLKIG
jgi:CRISPR-associated protein Csx1